MAVTEITSLDEYRGELQKPGLAVIDFYSTQCPPCKVRSMEIFPKQQRRSLLTLSFSRQVIAPLYEQIAGKETNKQVRFFKVSPPYCVHMWGMALKII